MKKIRLIDADALKKAINEWMPKDQETWMESDILPVENLVVSIMMTIEEQPTVDAVPHWIPCSERMPNDDKDYLVTDGESMAVGYYRTDAKAWDNVNFGWLEHREETCGLKPVVAWMPLPKPYEGDKE